MSNTEKKQTRESSDEVAASIASGTRVTRSATKEKLSDEHMLKTAGQFNRIATIKTLIESLPLSHLEADIDEIICIKEAIDEIHKTFNKEHQYIETTWPSTFITHDYFTQNAQGEEIQCHIEAQSKIRKLCRELNVTPKTVNKVEETSVTEGRTKEINRLPDIPIPKFSGDYMAWPSFKDLFESLVLKSSKLSDVQKFHYLRSTLEGSAFKMISRLSLQNTSLNIAWKKLIDKFDSPRLAVNPHLQKMLKTTPSRKRSAIELDEMINYVGDIIEGLNLFEIQNPWEALGVHQIIKQQDEQTRTEWERSLGNSKTYPSFAQLRTYFAAQVTALENACGVEGKEQKPQGKLKPKGKLKVKAFHTNTREDTEKVPFNKTCQYCKKDHRPNLNPDITDVLIWIRKHQFLFSTDITKIYRQIKVHKDDWVLQRILWIDDKGNETPYYLTTVTYGMRAAPFLAVRTLLQLVEDEGKNYPLAVPCITQGRYVDDIFGGADTQQELIEIALQLKKLCNAGGFPLAKWHSTHEDTIIAINADRNQEAIITFDCDTPKILGLQWDSQRDQFTFATTLSADNEKTSKRTILSNIAKIFDPLGFLSPVVIKAKMLLQELWLHKIKWDDPIPQRLSTQWRAIKQDLLELNQITIPRWLNTRNGSSTELHGFSDASQLAMAAVIYLTVHNASEQQTILICSKTKVAPLKRLSIPRLELTAALLLSKLTQYIRNTLNMEITATHLWTDSRVALTWIRSHASRWKDIVRNRVTLIQELTSNYQWNYVPGKANPADCASRGLRANQLKDHPLWWTGPSWLHDPDSWPEQPTEADKQSEQEARPGISLAATISKPDYHWDLVHKHSQLPKLLRITAACIRFIAHAKPHEPSSPNLTICGSLESSRLFWIKALLRPTLESTAHVLNKPANSAAFN
ncbi:PREDICTED: uncharacterized protein LOC105361126 [Ceratosolen solmsi marchali]|uniref:Uncharacterized protein LOC105361126 n=1 Tax=Ceratosolen solmsi marchali TaxID=326594 RepID=A0AAJ6YED8_9HYME|nr:PREDICTED: uncharacterized protein LOC105361126 [Ceratosolen solmsi marchali]